MDNNLEMFCLDWRRCRAKTLFPFARPRFFPTNEIPRVSTAAVHFGVGPRWLKISPLNNATHLGVMTLVGYRVILNYGWNFAACPNRFELSKCS